MSKTFNIEKKQIAFIRTLLRYKTASISADGKFRFGTSQRLVNLALDEVKKLASEGIIDFQKGNISINPLSKGWLKRKMASKQEQYCDQHRNVKINRKGVKLNINESPISRLTLTSAKKDPYLKAHHIEAAKRFSQLFERANLRSKITMSYNDGQLVSSKNSYNVKTDISDLAIDARKKVGQLLTNLPNDCASIIIDVCGYEKGLQTIESERGWPRRSAKLVLRIGLEQLAQNFGLSQQAIGKERNKPSHWLEEQSRPTRFE